jgi:hypothetical protein
VAVLFVFCSFAPAMRYTLTVTQKTRKTARTYGGRRMKKDGEGRRRRRKEC